MSAAPRIAICTLTAAASAAEQDLSLRLGLPLIDTVPTGSAQWDFYFRYEPQGLTLFTLLGDTPGGLCIDFDDPQLLRRTGDQLRQQNLCKAAGLKGKVRLRILDAMAGLGKDAWLLASGGAEVHLLERSPCVFALLQDAYERRLRHSSRLDTPVHRMHIEQADFNLVAATLPKFDVVYLDPMFPPTGTNARAKKDRYLLPNLLRAAAGEAERDAGTMTG